MKEAFLHYVWEYQLFQVDKLKLAHGQRLELIHAGIHNQDSGPDFFNAQIKIDGIRWAGNVEIHLNASDWIAHQHQDDEAYDKIILHVVWKKDRELFFSNGIPIPTLELKGLVKKSIINRYQQLQRSRKWIACENQFDQLSKPIKSRAIHQAFMERIELKSRRINQILQLRKNDWEGSLYQLIGKYFGFKVNAIPFELVCNSIPFVLIRKLQSNPDQLAALLFGQAGFLETDLKGDYPMALKNHYGFLKHKFLLKPMDNSMWKFMRMRPSNFPTIRIAQFAALYARHQKLFQQMVEAVSYEQIKALFKVEAATYWLTHYRFDIPSTRKSNKVLGDKSIELLLINVVIPFLYNYGVHRDDERLKKRAIQFMHKIEAEKNSIVQKWKDLGMPVQSAFESQGLLQLKSAYCQPKNCLNCIIGKAILNN